MTRRRRMLVLSAMLPLLASSAAFAVPKAHDIVLLLDNSSSMRRNDPGFLTRHALTEFLRGLSERARVAIVIFDQKVRLAASLTPVTDATRDRLLDKLTIVDYRGRFTNSPAGMERAIYELRRHARTDAEKIVIFMTDGIVHTGDSARDRALARWMHEVLAEEALAAGIRIFGIAFTDGADLQLIQNLTFRTAGTYFRATVPGEIGAVLGQISAYLHSTEMSPGQPSHGDALGRLSEVVSKVLPAVARVSEPPWIQSPALLILVGAGLTVIIVPIVMVLVPRRWLRPPTKTPPHLPAPAASAYAPPFCLLRDLSGATYRQSHDITGQRTRISRAAEEDSPEIRTLVINDNYISREHAVIEYRNYGYWIIDRGSANGSFVNDEKVVSERPLKHGDRLRFHTYEFEIILPEVEGAAETLHARIPWT